MEKFKYTAIVAFVVDDVYEVIVDLGNYQTYERAQLACGLYRENELFSHTFDYYHRLGISHMVMTYVVNHAMRREDRA